MHCRVNLKTTRRCSSWHSLKKLQNEKNTRRPRIIRHNKKRKTIIPIQALSRTLHERSSTVQELLSTFDLSTKTLFPLYLYDNSPNLKVIVQIVALPPRGIMMYWTATRSKTHNVVIQSHEFIEFTKYHYLCFLPSAFWRIYKDKSKDKWTCIYRYLPFCKDNFTITCTMWLIHISQQSTEVTLFKQCKEGRKCLLLFFLFLFFSL